MVAQLAEQASFYRSTNISTDAGHQDADGMVEITIDPVHFEKMAAMAWLESDSTLRFCGVDEDEPALQWHLVAGDQFKVASVEESELVVELQAGRVASCHAQALDVSSGARVLGQDVADQAFRSAFAAAYEREHGELPRSLK